MKAGTGPRWGREASGRRAPRFQPQPTPLPGPRPCRTCGPAVASASAPERPGSSRRRRRPPPARSRRAFAKERARALKGPWRQPGRRVHPRRLRPRGQERRTGSAVCMGQCRTNAPACRGFLRPRKRALRWGQGAAGPALSPAPLLPLPRPPTHRWGTPARTWRPLHGGDAAPANSRGGPRLVWRRTPPRRRQVPGRGGPSHPQEARGLAGRLRVQRLWFLGNENLNMSNPRPCPSAERCAGRYCRGR